MSETPEHANDPTGPVGPVTGPATSLPPSAAPEHHRPNRLYQVAAWVAIVAGSLLIVAVIFFAGFIVGKASDGGHGHFGHHHGGMKIERSGPMGPMMPPGGPGQGHMWPGPGNFGPGSPGMAPDRPDRPGAGPTTSAPGR